MLMIMIIINESRSFHFESRCSRRSRAVAMCYICPAPHSTRYPSMSNLPILLPVLALPFRLSGAIA